MANKTLFGKPLESYDSNTDDIDELLSKLTEAEIQELNNDIDPDNSLLPPSQRCRDQTTKAPTGPFDREKLIKFVFFRKYVLLTLNYVYFSKFIFCLGFICALANSFERCFYSTLCKLILKSSFRVACNNF